MGHLKGGAQRTGMSKTNKIAHGRACFRPPLKVGSPGVIRGNSSGDPLG